MRQNGMITDIRRFGIDYENLIEMPDTEWLLRLGDLIPISHEQYWPLKLAHNFFYYINEI